MTDTDSTAALASHQSLSMLLPSSVVSVYTTDPATREAAVQAVQDWRFARVRVRPIQGDIDTAIKTYAHEAAPDLIIIQTDTISDALTEKLETLAARCDENTAAIVIGPVNDVNLYRTLVDMGVSDYLVAPVMPDALADIIAKTLIDRLGISDSRLLAFVGAKGGVGTSVLTQAISRAAADVLQQKTVFFDGAGGWSANSVGLGFEPSTTLAEAAKAAAAHDEDSLARMIVSIDERLSVLASGGDALLEPTIRTDQMETLLEALMVQYPVVMADLSMTPPVLQKTVLMQAHHVFVISTPVLPALRLARSLIQDIRTLRGDDSADVDLIINMRGMHKAQEVSSKDLKDAMNMTPAALVPFNPGLFLKSEADATGIMSQTAGHQFVEQTLVPLLRPVLSLKPDEEAAPQAAQDGLLGRIGRLFKNDGAA